MKKDDAEVLREVQKNTEMAMKAIDTISDKVYDDDLAVQLSKQALKYSQIHNKALDKILAGKAEPYHVNNISQMMLVGGIHSNTLLDTSTKSVYLTLLWEAHLQLLKKLRLYGLFLLTLHVLRPTKSTHLKNHIVGLLHQWYRLYILLRLINLPVPKRRHKGYQFFRYSNLLAIDLFHI